MKQPCLEFDEGDEDFDPISLIPMKPRINKILEGLNDPEPNKDDGEE